MKKLCCIWYFVIIIIDFEMFWVLFERNIRGNMEESKWVLWVRFFWELFFLSEYNDKKSWMMYYNYYIFVEEGWWDENLENIVKECII